MKNKIKDKRIIGEKKLSDLYTWIDAVYDVHSNMRGHTWGAISMGYEIIYGKYLKQKINVKKYT